MCKAFHNGPLLSAGLGTHTHTRHTLGGKKANGLWASRGGDGAGHANDPSLDIWGGAGLAIRTAGGSFSDPNGSDSTHAQKIFEISLVQNLSAGMHSIKTNSKVQYSAAI